MGVRDPEVVKHWNWNYSYKIKGEDGFESRCLSVPPQKVERVKRAILAGKAVSEIVAILT
jgi:hypothetical protein